MFAWRFVGDLRPLDDLVALVQKGDDRAATELLRTLAPRASRIVHSLAGPTPSHDDLVQESLVDLLRALPRFEGRSSVETFLYGVCVHVVRRHRRAGARFLRALESFFGASARRDPSPGPYRELRAGERARAIHRLLDRLPARRREVLVLYEMEGRSAAEIAGILGIPEATVYTRLHHARKALRRLAEKAPELREEE